MSQVYRPVQYTNLQPHRGVLVLIMGILAIIPGMNLCGVFGIVAWALGSSDLKQMKAGVMDPEGMGMTQAGYIMGIISTILYVALPLLLLVFYVLFILIIVVFAAAAEAAGVAWPLIG